jgi:Fe-S-cluster-containing hydrogenase component 2
VVEPAKGIGCLGLHPGEHAKDMELIREGCTGSRACELVCAFLRTGGFTPDRSSVHVAMKRDGESATLDFGSTFDLCHDLPTPECVRYCASRVHTRERLWSSL